MRRHVVQAMVALFGAILVLGGLIAAGRAMRDRLKHEDQYQFPFAEISCNPPPGVDTTTFLGQVQYLGEFPDQVPILDDGLRARLKEAFERHGWVESAEVIIGPGRKIAVQLKYRTPILAVRYGNDTRAVDGTGILLPKSADATGLPLLTNAKPPAAGSGKPWGDAKVEGAVKIAAMLYPHQSTLKLLAFEYDERGLLVLRHEPQSWPAVIWGRAPGEEADGEPLAAAKLQRLLDRSASVQGLKISQSSREVIDLSKGE